MPKTARRRLMLGLGLPARRRSAIGLAGPALVAVALVAAACDRPPSADSLGVWTPADHHSTDDDRAAAKMGAGMQGAQVPMPAGSAAARGGDVAQLVDITWRQQCAGCHGPMGRGDGQIGPMVQAPDLTRADWQAKVSDAEIATTIKTGKNRMPRFDLPDPVLAGLVARIRSLASR